MSPSSLSLTVTPSRSSERAPHSLHECRKTKIVCTVGPACCESEQIHDLILSGANVFRLNFSHGDHAWHGRALETIRSQAETLKVPVAVMQDLCGPKIRLSRVARPDYKVAAGEIVRITTDAYLESPERAAEAPDYDVASTYAPLIDDVRTGDRLLVDDGRVALLVVEKKPGLVLARVTRGGAISPGKGLNLPGVALSTKPMTAKDWIDLEWGIAHEVDYVALSFVRHPDDLLGLRTRLDDSGCSAKLIAKIEHPNAVEHIEQIVELADGLMVARGDLGLETDLAHVPLLQKHLIECCRRQAKPVITATQMLDSMVHDSTPTRAEVSDVANAIFDGSDAIMLSNETAMGKFPLEAVDVIHRVSLVTEADLARRVRHDQHRRPGHSDVGAMTEAAAVSATALGARCVVVYSQTGYTATMMARYRLPMPVVAVTNLPSTYRQLSLSYGVRPVYLPQIVNLPQLLDEMDHLVVEQKWGEPGDMLVVVSALDGRDGHIDTLHLHRVSH